MPADPGGGGNPGGEVQQTPPPPPAVGDAAQKPRRRWKRAGGGVSASGGGGADGGADGGGVGSAASGEVAERGDQPPPPQGRGRGTAPDEAGGRAGGKGRSGKGKNVGGTAGGAAACFNEGARQAFELKYRGDIERLYAREDLPASARWVDSHCHLESILQRTWRGGGKPQVTEREAAVDIPALVASWPPGVDACICNCVFRRPSKPGFTPEWAWIEENLPAFEASEPSTNGKLWFTIGIHPHDADNWDAVAEATIRRLGTHAKCVGVGECGLDFFKHDRGEADKQLRAFRAQAKLAVELGKALVVHARLVTPANEDMFLAALQEEVPAEHPIHIHCYSDSLAHATQLLEGWPNLRIGFTGSITFKDKGKGGGSKGKGGVVEKKGEAHCEELIKGLPVDRLLIETDGPYMCPEPFRGHTAHPGHVHRVAERIAEWKSMPLGEVLAATRKSTRVVYGI